jgi:hypothetical protein
MASPEKKIANFRFPCGHKVAQQTGNRIDSTQVDEKINFDFRGDPLEGRKLKISKPFPESGLRTLQKQSKIVTFLARTCREGGRAAKKSAGKSSAGAWL